MPVIQAPAELSASSVTGAGRGSYTYSTREILHIRHHNLFAPRDFDLSSGERKLGLARSSPMKAVGSPMSLQAASSLRVLRRRVRWPAALR